MSLALELAGLHQPPPRRPDYTATINGQSYPLADESDEGKTIVVWTKHAPACPRCGELLLTHGHEDRNQAPVHFYSAWCAPDLICDGCDARIALEDGR